MDPSFLIDSAQFCKTGTPIDDCHKIHKESKNVKFANLMDFEIKFDPSYGITATLQVDIKFAKDRPYAFDGLYYCHLENKLGSIKSNYFEFQDYEFYKKKIVKLINPIGATFQVQPTNDIRTDSFPIYLDCGKPVGNYEDMLPKWVNNDLLVSFDWTLCPGATDGITCFANSLDTRTKKARPLEELISYYQFPNGTIVLMDIKGSDYKPSGLMCSSKFRSEKPNAVYFVQAGTSWRTIRYIESSYMKRITVLSPTDNDVTIREGIYHTTRFKLNAVYIANPEHTKTRAEWKKNGFNLGTNFESKPFKLTFPTEITEAHAGTYVLTVTQFDGPLDKAVFTYRVKVLSPPKVKDNVKHSPILYCTVNQNVNLMVSFEKNITGTKIEINAKNIDISKPQRFEESMKELGNAYPFLQGLNVNVTTETHQDQVTFIYQADNLGKNKGGPQPKTHTVTFIAENKVGISKASFLIRVFESPVFINYLNEFNCVTNCRHDEKHIFKCSVDAMEYLSEGCTIKHLWALNDYSLNSMNTQYDSTQYFQIIGDMLILKPINSGNAKKDKEMAKLLANSTVRCQIIIYEPVQPGLTPSVKLYSTDNDPRLKSLLEAKINLSVTAVDVATASWILPVIISCIVLIIIVVLILYFCLRGSGETYNVDQKERAQGHDPEKEIRDNETFQPYERDHETNTNQPSHLSFNDEDSVGVGSDDGELDVYDIDPGKFNEEGSFIGQYASDPRKNKSAKPA